MPSVKTNPNQTNQSYSDIPLDKYNIGDTGMFMEIPKYLNGVKESIDASKVQSLFNNKAMTLEETEGRSLKVMFRTEHQIKFCGFVTAADASIELDDSDIEKVLEQGRTSKIIKAISPSELVDMW